MPRRVLALSGSPRVASWNTALLRAAARLAPDGLEVVLVDTRDVPLYDPDVPEPEAVTRLKAAVAGADGLLVATPEYNHSIPGVLKNTLDWLSRPAYQGPLVGKPVGVVSASPGLIGGARAQAHLKEVLLAIGAHVLPGREVCVGAVDKKITLDGEVLDPGTATFLEGWLRDLRDFVATWSRPS